jgi:hypothetical protein
MYQPIIKFSRLTLFCMNKVQCKKWIGLKYKNLRNFCLATYIISTLAQHFKQEHSNKMESFRGLFCVTKERGGGSNDGWEDRAIFTWFSTVLTAQIPPKVAKWRCKRAREVLSTVLKWKPHTQLLRYEIKAIKPFISNIC